MPHFLSAANLFLITVFKKGIRTDTNAKIAVYYSHTPNSPKIERGHFKTILRVERWALHTLDKRHIGDLAEVALCHEHASYC